MATARFEHGVLRPMTNVRRAGRVCLWAGLLGAVSGVFLVVVPPAVESDRYSYPLTAAGFVAIQVWFAAQHLGLLAGILALGRSGAAGARLLGVRAAAAGMGLLTLAEIAAIAAAGSSYPSPGTEVLDALYGISVVAIGAGLVAAGIAVVRRDLWRGRSRWLPLVTGLYAFVPMMPLMFMGYLGARLAITGWMLLFAALGWMLGRESSR
ncbi:MAG: hypothetical protein ACRC50_04270 [Gaiella sp.]